MMLVSPSRSRSVVEISRFPNVGYPEKPVPDTLLSDTFTASVTSLLAWNLGVMSMLTPMFS